MQPLKREIVETIEQFIVGSPFGRLVGLESLAIEQDCVRVRLPYRTDVTTIGEMVHGGAIASLVDVAATAAAWATPEATLDARGSTVGLTMNYLAPGLGRDLIAEARITKRGGAICMCDVRVENPDGLAIANSMVTYRLSLPKPDPGLAVVRAYGEAKSRQDVTAALIDCHEDFSIETVAFRMESRDREDTRAQLEFFFAAFPDYCATVEQIARSGDQVLWSGRVAMTFSGALLGIAPTGRKVELPAFCVFEFKDDRLLREKYYFDLALFCEGIGIPIDELTAVFSSFAPFAPPSPVRGEPATLA